MPEKGRKKGGEKGGVTSLPNLCWTWKHLRIPLRKKKGKERGGKEGQPIPSRFGKKKRGKRGRGKKKQNNEIFSRPPSIPLLRV